MESVKHQIERRLVRDARVLRQLDEKEKEIYLRFIDIEGYIKKKNDKRCLESSSNKIKKFENSTKKDKSQKKLIKSEPFASKNTVVTSRENSNDSKMYSIIKSERELKRNQKLRYLIDYDKFWKTELLNKGLMRRNQLRSLPASIEFCDQKKNRKKKTVHILPLEESINESYAKVIDEVQSPTDSFIKMSCESSKQIDIWKLPYRERQRLLDKLFADIPTFKMVNEKIEISDKIDGDRLESKKLQLRAMKRLENNKEFQDQFDLINTQLAYNSRLIEQKNYVTGISENYLYNLVPKMYHNDAFEILKPWKDIAEKKRNELQQIYRKKDLQNTSIVLANYGDLIIKTLGSDSQILHTPRSLNDRKSLYLKELTRETEAIRHTREVMPALSLKNIEDKTEPIKTYWDVHYKSDYGLNNLEDLSNEENFFCTESCLN